MDAQLEALKEASERRSQELWDRLFEGVGRLHAEIRELKEKLARAEEEAAQLRAGAAPKRPRTLKDAREEAAKARRLEDL